MNAAKETIWHFTPSNTSPEALEAVLIEREPILQELQEAVKQAVESRRTRHYLLVGPRGAGKTHVISVLRNRLAADSELRNKLVLAWLPEDMFGMSKPVDWFRTVANELGRRDEIPEILEAIQALKSPSERTAESLSRLIVSLLGDRVLVIFHENLNRVFKQLGSAGQQSIRAFLQNNPQVMLVATAPSLSEAVLHHDAPFHGMLIIRSLEELTLEGALDLFIRLARQRNDEETIAYLQSPAGKGRVQAVHLLAGSNPRILVVFAAMMSRNGLDKLLPLFERTIDDLTPYYQERMESLSGQQQSVINFFLRSGKAITPVEAAEELWLDQRTVGKVLADLVDLGFLRRRQDGKRSWYDLREPLMKMAWQVKDAKTEPLELIVDFVRVWFTPTEAKDQANCAPHGTSVFRTLLRAAILGPRLDLEPMEGADEMQQELEERWNDFDPKSRVIACQKLISQRSKSARCQDFMVLVRAHWMADEFQEVAQVVADHEESANRPLEYNTIAVAYLGMNRPEKALSAVEKCLRLNASDPLALQLKCGALVLMGHYKKAIDTASMAIKLAPDDPWLWTWRSEALAGVKRYDEGQTAARRAIELDDRSSRCWASLADCLRGLRRYGEALEAIDRAIEIDPDAAYIWRYRSVICRDLGQATDEQYALEMESTIGTTRFVAAASALAEGRAEDFKRSSRIGLGEAMFLDEYQGGLDEVLFAMLESTPEAQFEPLIAHLLESTVLPRLHEEMGKALVKSIRKMLHPVIPIPRAEHWLTTWRELTVENTAYVIPIRILECAVRYKGEPSQIHLMELSTEERAILTSLLPAEPPKLRGRKRRAS